MSPARREREIFGVIPGVPRSQGSMTEMFTPKQRASGFAYTIDPGFVHFRRIQTVVAGPVMVSIDGESGALPALPEGLKLTRLRQIYTSNLLRWCRATKVPSLAARIGSNEPGVCLSVEELASCKNVREVARAVSVRVDPTCDRRVELRYSTEHLTSETARTQLEEGDVFAVVGTVTKMDTDLVVVEPMVIGSPWPIAESPEILPGLEWYVDEWSRIPMEAIDQFAKAASEPLPSDSEPMKDVTERAFKQCLAELLGDTVPNDWGGETSDYFTSHMSIDGRSYTAAFLLKGPARFSPMETSHLGKNQDQLLRLTEEPAEILVLQHCHEVTSGVRKLVRMLSLQPTRSRRYCVMDGRDSLRLLRAYGLFDRALELSRQERLRRGG
jgi:hypothetical protein